MILKAVVIRMNKKDLSERDICTKHHPKLTCWIC